MKFRLLSLSFIIFLGSHAQDSFTRCKYFGLELGPNFSTILYNSSQVSANSSISGKIGMTAGINYENVFKPRISIKYGFLLERKGAVFSTSSFWFASSETVKLNYFVIPILFSYNNLAGMYCNLGPYAGALFLDNLNFKRFDLGAVFGVGVKFKISKNVLFDIGVKENLGLMNVKTTEPKGYRNNSILLNFSLKFKM